MGARRSPGPERGEIEQELLDLIAVRLGTAGEKVHTGGLEQLHWATAGKATVLVHLPAAGIPPITVAVVEAGGGVVLRGWPDAWAAEDRERGTLALREHQAWPRIAVPVVAALKDLGVVVGAGVQGKLQHPAPAKAHGAFSEGQPGGAAGSALWEEGAARGQLSHPGGSAWLRGAAARFRHAGRSQEACLVCAAPRLALLPAAAVYHYCCKFVEG